MKHQPNRYWSTTKISNIGTKTATRIPSIIIWRVHWSRIWQESSGCNQLYGSRFLKALSWSMILNVYLQQKLETRHLLLFSFRGNPATCGSLGHQPRCSCIKVKSNPCRWLPIHQVICPRHDNFREMSDRKYRSSLDAAFSANVAFVLYECESAPIKRVATLHQESITICSEWTRVQNIRANFTIIIKIDLIGKIGQNRAMLRGALRLGGVQGEILLCHHLSVPKDV